MIRVPPDKIFALPYDDYYRGKQDQVFFSFKGLNKREWFSKHAYYCLPLVMGNQHGFGLRSLYDLELTWNGGETPADTTIRILNTDDQARHASLQVISSHFGLGIVTVQTAFALRTPPNVSLMTIQPPNIFIDGLQNLTGVIETDNLRRDFTFNLKLTRPDFTVQVKQGDILSAFIPYPRGFIDNFELVDACSVLDTETIQQEQKAAKDAGHERAHEDPGKPRGIGRRYHEGEDVYGNRFEHPHQKSLLKPRKRK